MKKRKKNQQVILSSFFSGSQGIKERNDLRAQRRIPSGNPKMGPQMDQCQWKMKAQIAEAYPCN